MDTTCLYLTSGELDPVVRKTCLQHLHTATPGIDIVMMNQPDDWPICGLSMYKMMLSGLSSIKTKYVAIAEHDCVYSKEHFEFVPPDDRYFWYNLNSWFLQYKNPRFPEMDGMFSFIANRRVQSQLICRTDKLIEATEMCVKIITDPEWESVRGNRGVGEPGAVDYDKAMHLTRGSKKEQLRNRIKDYLIGYEARDFQTTIPNIDIRHQHNFTGPRRGTKRYRSLEPWGSMDDIMVK